MEIIWTECWAWLTWWIWSVICHVDYLNEHRQQSFGMQTTPFNAKFHKSNAIRIFRHTHIHNAFYMRQMCLFLLLSICVRFLFLSSFCCIVIVIRSYAQYQSTEFYLVVFSPSFQIAVSSVLHYRSTKVHEKHTRTYTAKEKTDWFPKTFHSMQFTTMSPISVNKSTILCFMVVCALLMAHVQSASINSTTDLAEDRSFKSEPVGKHHSHSHSHSQSYK